jgi:hypothetical protein
MRMVTARIFDYSLDGVVGQPVGPPAQGPGVGLRQVPVS